MGARQFCSVDGVPVQSAAIALHSAPGARRLAIGGALVAAALAGKMAGIYAIQAMERCSGRTSWHGSGDGGGPSGSPDRPVVPKASRAHGGRRLRLSLLFVAR